MKLTANQIELMGHTFNPSRNWFGTDYGTDDSREFEKLVAAGLAVAHSAPSWVGNEVIYMLTKEGKQALSAREVC